MKRWPWYVDGDVGNGSGKEVPNGTDVYATCASLSDAGAEGTEPHIGVKEDEAVVVGRFGARSRLRPGDEVTAAVDTRALHFFDPDTGEGIYDDTTPSKGAPS